MHFHVSPWIEPSAPRQSEQSQRNGIDEDESLFSLFRGFATTLWRWRLLILALVAAGLLAAWLILLTLPSSYIARAEVYFDFSRQTAVSDLPAATVAPTETMLNTEMELVVSRNQMTLVVEKFNLTEDPEFNPWLIETDDAGTGEPVTSDAATEDPETGELATDGLVIDGLATEGLATGEPEAGESIAPLEEQVRRTAVSILLGKVDVRLIPNSYVFSITVETLDPEKSAAIANGIAELFIETRNQRRVDASEDAISWLEDRTTNLRDRVREAETEVANLRALSSPGGDSDITATAARIAYLRERDATLEARARRLSGLSDQLRGVSAPADVDAGLKSELSEFSASLLLQLDDAAAEGDSERYGTLIDEMRTRISEAASDVRREEARIRTELDGMLDVYSERTAEAQALRDAERESAASLASYEALLDRLKDRIAVGALDPFWPEATVISPAVPAGIPAFPDRELILAFGGIGGLALGSGLALLLSALFPVLSSPREVARATGVPVLVRVPLRRGARLSSLQRQIERRGRSRRRSPLDEGLSALQTAVALESRGPGPHVVLLTSADQCDGKSTIGYLLAQSFVQGGRKVLLIDADQDTAVQSGQGAASLGLGDIIFAKADLKDAITQDPSSGADVLVAQHALREDAHLFGFGTDERGYLDKIASRYDLTILVAPPIESLSDARIFSMLADCVLVLMRKHTSRPATVSSALNMLINAGASRVATVWLSRSGR